jgi:hypothetical protein
VQEVYAINIAKNQNKIIIYHKLNGLVIIMKFLKNNADAIRRQPNLYKFDDRCGAFICADALY